MIEFEGVRISQDDTVSQSDESGRAEGYLAIGNPLLRPVIQTGEASAPSSAEPSRAELLQQLDAAQHALESQLEGLRSSGALSGGDMQEQGSARLKHLNFLRDQLVSGANGLPLAALRAEITSAVSDIRAYTSDVRAASTSPASDRAATETSLQQASAEAHRAVGDFMHDFYDRRIFDPYLKFASEKDKEEYFRREETWKQEIEKARAEHTPEGELRASDMAIEQLEDAGAHGADRSSKYKSTLSTLRAQRERLSQQLGKTTKTKDDHETAKADPADNVQPDQHVPADVIASLRASGVTGAQQNDDGHGLTVRDSQSTVRGRG
ncbi:MAG: hypothetical protein GC184_13720 [Rhizobiales bacterium]|nr:hypothetical protein [Hyphomicrobiales bacterium]